MNICPKCNSINVETLNHIDFMCRACHCEFTKSSSGKMVITPAKSSVPKTTTQATSPQALSQSVQQAFDDFQKAWSEKEARWGGTKTYDGYMEAIVDIFNPIGLAPLIRKWRESQPANDEFDKGVSFALATIEQFVISIDKLAPKEEAVL